MATRSFCVAACVALLAACGGGDAGFVGEQDLAEVATLQYGALGQSELPGGGMKYYDPFTPVDLQPAVTGLPDSVTRTFRATSLPEGLALDAATGRISGPARDSYVTVEVSMTAPGYAGEITTFATARVAELLGSLESLDSGFVAADSSTSGARQFRAVAGTAGKLRVTVSSGLRMDWGLSLVTPWPEGAVIRYGMDTVPPGLTFDPASGVLQGTPTTPGAYVLDWSADVTARGVTRHYRNADTRLEVGAPPDLAGRATLQYRATNLATPSYDLWTAVDLRPVVTGVPEGVTRTFRVQALPAGLTLDAATGAVTGMVQGNGADVPLDFTMTAQGYTGELTASYRLRVDNLVGTVTSQDNGFIREGSFTLGFLPEFRAYVGTAGKLLMKVMNRSYNPDQGSWQVGTPFPDGTTITYGMTSLPPGLAFDSSTGLLQGTPTLPGRYVLDWYADVTARGITRRYRNADLSLNVH